MQGPRSSEGLRHKDPAGAALMDVVGIFSEADHACGLWEVDERLPMLHVQTCSAQELAESGELRNAGSTQGGFLDWM